MLPLPQQCFTQQIERRNPDAAAEQHDVVCRNVGVIPVAEPGQHVERFTGPQGRHLCGALAHDLIDQGQRIVLYVADRDRPAQEQTVQLQVDKLPGRGDRRHVARQTHQKDVLCQRAIVCHCQNHLFHKALTNQWWKCAA